MAQDERPAPSDSAEPKAASPAPDQTGTAAAPTDRPRGRWLWRLAIGAALVLVVLATALVVGWRSSATLPWLLARVPGLTAEGVSGSISGRQVQIDRLDWILPAQAGRLQLRGLDLSGVSVVVQPHAGAWAGLHIQRLSVAALAFRPGPPAADSAPAQAPQQLTSPVDLTIDALQIDRIDVQSAPAMRALQASVAIGEDRGQRHQITLQQLRLWPQTLADGQLETDEQAIAAAQPASAGPAGLDLASELGLSGSLRLSSAAPLTLDAQLRAQSQTGRPWQADLSAQGPLQQPTVKLQLAVDGNGHGQAQTLAVDAMLQPWAAWPLDQLQLRTEALNLRALSPAWPITALTGRADVRTQGLDAPAEVDLQLTNAAPGALDEGRLPLREAQVLARGTPGEPDRLSLQRFDLRLGDADANAGRITGSGNWREGKLALDLQIADLEPARLHGSATPMRLEGPLTLRASGLAGEAAATAWRLDWTGQLAGNALPPVGPGLTLSTQGQASPGSVVLKAVQLQAGQASASVQGRMDWHSSGWQLKADARLVDFDPRPWWRGQARPAAKIQAQNREPASRPAPPASPPPAAATRPTGQAAARPAQANPLASAWPPGPTRLDATLSADIQGDGPLSRLASQTPEQWLKALSSQTRLALSPSLLGGMAISGQASAQGRGPDLQLAATLTVGGNTAAVQSSAGSLLDPQRSTSPVRMTWQAPDLATLGIWRDWVQRQWPDVVSYWPRSGRTDGQLQWQGGQASGPLASLLAGGATEGRAKVEQLAMPLGTLNAASLSWQLASVETAPLKLSVALDGWRSPGAALGPAQPAGPSAARGVTTTARAGPPSARAGSSAAKPAAAPVPGETRLDLLRAEIDGTVGEHRITARIESPLRPPAAAEPLLGPAGTGSQIEFGGTGQWLPTAAGSEWRLMAARLQIAARGVPAGSAAWIQAPALNATVQLGPKGNGLRGLTIGAGEARLARTTALRWKAIDWQPDPAIPGGRWAVDATLDRFDLAQLLGQLQPGVGWGGDLAVGGSIQVRSDQRLDADILLERVGGDLTLTDELGQVQRMGLTDLRLSATAHDGVWQLAQGLAGRSIGTVVGAQVVRTTAGARWPGPEDALQGVLQARVGNLGAWGSWVPPGWRLSGALDAEVQVAGRVGAPELRGRLSGSDLGLRNVLQGVALSDGVLSVALEGERLNVERFDFQAGKGRITLTGAATLGEQPEARLRLVAEQARVLGRIDRRIIASGQADLVLDAKRLALDGRFTVDEGLFDISRSDAPSLDDDVVVHRQAPSAPQAAAVSPARTGPVRETAVKVVIDLGRNLRLRGQGVDTRLAGEVTLTAPEGVPALNGTVRTVEGRYQAYGQKLEITRGEFAFSGPVGNPRLDVLAIRPNLDVSVGVAIGGTALRPQVRLYSEPDLTDYDKLSWLVLGRGPDGLGSADTALLQRAALALLSGNNGPGPTDQLLGALGISDFSLRQGGDANETIISLGRQLSRRWYVGYERSVNATSGTWQLIYRIAQRFTLRAQSGNADNAVDLIWSWRW